MSRYVYQKFDWPNFYWESGLVLMYLGEIRYLQGRLIGKLDALGFEMRDYAQLETLSTEILKSSEIEGYIYRIEEVRSSVAVKLGLNKYRKVTSGKDVDGIVEMMVDALSNYDKPLTKERLFRWHTSLFPVEKSDGYNIAVGEYRKETTGPMRVVSGALGREVVHFQAPHSDVIPKEMDDFLEWFNEEQGLDPIIKAGVAHLWFLTLHPFEDGNGRLARALTDLFLARSDKSTQQFYSLSAEIMKQRSAYYKMLEKSQKGDTEITEWMMWFLSCFHKALITTQKVLDKTLKKADFWKEHAQTRFNERQLKIVNLLHDGFDGKLTSSKWAKICKCSQDTAIRDLNDLVTKRVLHKAESGGRSTSYLLSDGK